MFMPFICFWIVSLFPMIFRLIAIVQKRDERRDMREERRERRDERRERRERERENNNERQGKTPIIV